MTNESELYEKLTQHISAVGSDVRDLKYAFEKHLEEDSVWKRTDAEWKLLAQPVIDMGKSMQGFGIVMKGLAGIVLSMAAVVGILIGFFQWLKE